MVFSKVLTSADPSGWWGAWHTRRMGNTPAPVHRRLTIKGGFTVDDARRRDLHQQARRLGIADLRGCLQALLDDGWSTPSSPPTWPPPKLARQFGMQNIVVLHHLSDLRAAGDTGSRTAELAIGLLADAATRVIHHLDEGQVRASADLLGLNHTHQQVIPRLGRGAALWLVGDRAWVVHHHLTKTERWIVDTDHAMLGHPPSEALP